jgi:NADPH2:quinone reductase
MSEMKAVRIFEAGNPDVLMISETDSPKPGPGQLLIKTAWAGINYIDIYQRSGKYSLQYPATLGLEGSGEVVEVGPGESSFKIGDRVCWAWAPGSYAEFTLLNEDKAVLVPDGISMDVAAATMLQALTAHYLISSVYKAHAGDFALVHAAAGGVGLLLCQMLKAKGVRVIGTVSSSEKAAAALAAGAEYTIRYDEEAFPARVAEITAGKKCQVVFDGVGATTFEGSLLSLCTRGTLALFGSASGEVPLFDLQRLNTLGSLVVTRPSLAHFIQTAEELNWRCKEIFEEILAGRLKIEISNRYDLANASQAHADLESRGTSGKLILRVSGN